jgi:hypothetical protein
LFLFGAQATVQKKHRESMGAGAQQCVAGAFVYSASVPISATGAKAEEALVKIENVGQGSRQNRLVTLEEELAL